MKRTEPNQLIVKRDESTIERIMRMVAAMYRERGYERSSMSALARRVGITAPALYHYFGSKEEILAAFLEYTLNDLFKTVSAAGRGQTSRENISNVVTALVKWQLQQTPFPGAYDRIFALGHLRQSLPPELRERVLRIEKEIYKYCKSIIVRGIAAGEFRPVPVAPTTFAILGIGDYILGWYRHDGKLSPSNLAKVYADLIVSMLQPEQKPSNLVSSNAGVDKQESRHARERREKRPRSPKLGTEAEITEDGGKSEVIKAIASGKSTTSALVQTTGLPNGQVSGILAELMREGRVVIGVKRGTYQLLDLQR